MPQALDLSKQGFLVVIGLSGLVAGTDGTETGLRIIHLPQDRSVLLEAFALSGGESKAGNAAKESLAGERPKILVAEDSALQRRVWTGALRDEGFRVSEAEDGAKAFAAALADPPDLILTDVEMPNMTGYELCAKVKGDPRLAHIPVFILTTLGGFHQIQRGFDVGASDYMVKPKDGEREAFLDMLVERVTTLFSMEGITSRGHVMVVDDSDFTRSMIQASMEKAGFIVTPVSSGDEARDLLNSDHDLVLDLVVTDVEMPGISGIELAHFIRTSSRIPNIPILVLTASREQRNRELGKGIGVDGYLTKPFSHEKLVLAAENAISSRLATTRMTELTRILGHDVVDAVKAGHIEPRWVDMTILFTDLVGFSNLCARSTAADVVALLNSYIGEMVPVITANRGYINKFIGDAIMVLFRELPGEQPAAIRAVRCGIGMQRAMAPFNIGRPEKLSMRMGINSGEVILGTIGSGDRLDYTVIGDHVNRAARLEGKCTPDKVLISKPTFERAKDWFVTAGVRYTDSGGLELKGIAEPVQTYTFDPDENQGLDVLGKGDA
jgi:CheY-like chemotaxis protein